MELADTPAGNSAAAGGAKRTKSSQSDETKTGRPGRPANQLIVRLRTQHRCSRSTAYRKLAKKHARQRTRRDKLETATTQFSELIKPSDNWNFFEVFYDRIDGEAGHGYIPGELYVNCLWYFTHPGDLVIAPMAGSGQIKRVYDDRALWMRPQPWDVDLRMFDLTPRGPYMPLIGQWNMLDGFPPVARPPDYVVLDVPYLGCCNGQYSTRRDDIANMDAPAWTAAMTAIAQACAVVKAKLCTVVAPDWVDHNTGEVVLCTEIIREAWRNAGYRLYRKAYATKHIQSARTERIAALNNRAKRLRLTLSDISEVLTFALL
jgi:ParB family chromosome partitioning protein